MLYIGRLQRHLQELYLEKRLAPVTWATDLPVTDGP